MNSRKWRFDDVLDPFELHDDWFHLELVTGHVYPNPGIKAADKEAVRNTINRLGLDDPECKDMRARRFDEYVNQQLPADLLRRYSPFVWREAKRQGLL